jgi:hypothetical protein
VLIGRGVTAEKDSAARSYSAGKFICFTNEIETANRYERPLISPTNHSVREGKIDTFLYSLAFSGPS